MSKWIVQRIANNSFPSTDWEDVVPKVGTPWRNPAWEADDAGHAFKLAVLDNAGERIQAQTYRVLPFTGGARFHVDLNIDATEHDTAQPVAAA